jgi:hypothetical protein
VVGLHPSNRERRPPPDVGQEVEAAPLIEVTVQPEHPVVCTVVTGGVLVGLRAGELHDLDVDLEGITGARRRFTRWSGGKPRSLQIRVIVLVATSRPVTPLTTKALSNPIRGASFGLIVSVSHGFMG